MTQFQILMVVLICAGITVLTRAIAFLLFSGKQELPPFVTYLGVYLPRATMAMLLVFCVKDVSLLSAPFGLPQLLGLAATVSLHVWKKNIFLSIAGGAAVCMALTQLL